MKVPVEVLLPRLRELFPDASSYITTDVDDIRPWVELQNLILTAPEDQHPQFLIYGSTVTIPLGTIGLALFSVAENRDLFVQTLFNTILAYKERL